MMHSCAPHTFRDRLSRAWHQPQLELSHQPSKTHQPYLLQSQFVSQLPQHALSSEELSHNSRAKAQHGQTGDEHLVVRGEPDLEASQRGLALLLLGGGLLGELQTEGSSRVGDSKSARTWVSVWTATGQLTQNALKPHACTQKPHARRNKLNPTC